MSKITIFEQLRSCAQAARDFANSLVAEVADATADAIEELAGRVNTVEQKVGGFSYSEAEEMLTVPEAFGTVADETLVLK